MNERENGDPNERLSRLTATFRDLEAYVQQDRIRTIHYGIGAIGAEVVRTVLNTPEIEIVGAVDASPAKAGKDLGEAAGVGHALGIAVSYEPEPLLKDVYADVVVHCTGSSLTEVYPQIMSMVSSEKSVVSSCEELAFPWVRYPDMSNKLDRRAHETGVRILGAGVNPGFVMDLLPLTLATVCQRVKAVRVQRVVDIRTRRIQLQRKTGVGLSVAGFQQAASAGVVGHSGLRESIYMIADTLGWKLEDVSETLEPVLARERLRSEFFSIEKGYTAGLRQSAFGVVSGQETIRLDLEMTLGAREPLDRIEIDGEPPLRVVIPNGIHGDRATASILANYVPAVARSRLTGLLSMRDLGAMPYFRPRTPGRDEP
jgi:4-hydroxy-tetrahydrodipicolinate reductase